MKIEITGIVDKVHGIQSVRKGFTQTVILQQPATKDEYDRITHHEQYFVISIWSNSQTDSRFLSSKDMRSKLKAVCYMKGERWFNDRTKDFNYAHKLNLSEWSK